MPARRPMIQFSLHSILTYFVGTAVLLAYLSSLSAFRLRYDPRAVDLSIKGEGYFLLYHDSKDKPRTTREGQFHVGPQGYLRWREEDWYIVPVVHVADDAERIEVTSDGAVWQVDQTEQKSCVGSIGLVVDESDVDWVSPGEAGTGVLQQHLNRTPSLLIILLILACTIGVATWPSTMRE